VFLACVSISLLSYSLPGAYHAGLSLYNHEEGAKGYGRIRADIIRDLCSIPKGALVITPSGPNTESYVNFIRPDLLMIQPTLPLRMEQLSKIDKTERVYVYLNWETLPSDDTFFSQYKESNKKLIQIK
jgi:hypothetical protein